MIISQYDKKDIAIAVLLAVVLCLACYMFSLAREKVYVRSRFQKVYGSSRAYYMARSGAEHLILKLRTMRQYQPNSVFSLGKGLQEEKELLNKVFVEDIVAPSDESNERELYGYKITEFSTESEVQESEKLTIQFKSEGMYNGYNSSIKRLVRIGR